MGLREVWVGDGGMRMIYSCLSLFDFEEGEEKPGFVKRLRNGIKVRIFSQFVFSTHSYPYPA